VESVISAPQSFKAVMLGGVEDAVGDAAAEDAELVELGAGQIERVPGHPARRVVLVTDGRRRGGQRDASEVSAPVDRVQAVGASSLTGQPGPHVTYLPEPIWLRPTPLQLGGSDHDELVLSLRPAVDRRVELSDGFEVLCLHDSAGCS